MMFPVGFWILLAVTAFMIFIGFGRKLWVITFGYGLSAAAAGVVLYLLYRPAFTSGAFACCVLLFIFGCIRVGSAIKHGSWNPPLKIPDGAAGVLGVILANGLFIVRYTLNVSAVLYCLHNGGGSNLWMWIGAAIMTIALLLEALMHWSLHHWIDLFMLLDSFFERFTKETMSISFYDNLCVIFFWTGVFVCGISGVSGLGQWIVVLLAYIVVLYEEAK